MKQLSIFWITSFFLDFSAAVRTNYLKAIYQNGTSLCFAYKFDTITTMVPDYYSKNLYGFTWRSGATYIAIINITDYYNICSKIVKVNNSVSSIAGVINLNVGFNYKLELFSLNGDSEIYSAGLLNEYSTVLYSALSNNVITINSSHLTLYAYDDTKKFIPVLNVPTKLRNFVANNFFIICGAKTSSIYAVINKYQRYYLLSFDYYLGYINKEILLPGNLNNSITSFLVLSSTEEYIAVYGNYKIYFYRIDSSAFAFIKSIDIQLSAITALPSSNSIIAKSGSNSSVYIISMSAGEISQQMAIDEKEYLTNIYVSTSNEKTLVLFTDFRNWYGYTLEFNEEIDTKSLVNAYIILMSIFLILALIISVIYILYSRNTKTENPVNTSTFSQNESNGQIVVDQRNQMPVPGAFDTRTLADTNETKTGFINAEIYRRQFLVCPLTGIRMKDPVVAADGYTYERKAIEQWIDQNSISPITREPLANKNLIPNSAVADCLSKSNKP